MCRDVPSPTGLLSALQRRAQLQQIATVSSPGLGDGTKGKYTLYNDPSVSKLR
jgi:hypothetical protein